MATIGTAIIVLLHHMTVEAGAIFEAADHVANGISLRSFVVHDL